MIHEQHTKRINHYFYDQAHLIAKGSRSRVYRGIDSSTGHTVAIKVVACQK